MKKFSVLLVMVLAAAMLFVSCESKPKERDATTEDLKLISLLSSACEYAIDKKLPGTTVDYENWTATFDNVKVESPYGDTIVICGSLVGEGKINLTSGTSVNGKGHTLTVNASKGETTPIFEVLLDGVKLNGLDDF